MTLQEILKSKNLSDEDIKSITTEMKENKLYTSSEENLDIRYKDLQSKFESKDKEYKEATTLIEQLKKDKEESEPMREKIAEYDSKMLELQSELTRTKIDTALKMALVSEKAIDLDYLAFKIKEKGELKLGEDGKIKGLGETLKSLKTQFPTQFSSEAKRKIEETKLKDGVDNHYQEISKEQFKKLSYQGRLDFYNENPDAYKELSEN